DNQQKKVDKLQEQVEAYAEIGDYDTVATLLADNKKALKALQVQLADLKEDLANQQKDEDVSEDALVSLKRSIRDLEGNIADKQAEISTQEALLKSLEPSKQLKADLKEATKKLTSLQKIRDEKNAELAKFDGVLSVEEAKAAVKEKQKNLNQLIDALADKKAADALTAQSDAMDQKAAQDEIERQREKVKKLEESSDLTEVKAEEDGMISAVNCKAGDSVTADMALAEVQSLNSSFLVNVTVTMAQAALLRVGDEAMVENVWDRDLTAKVRSLKANPENPNQSKLASFEISDNANPGETLQLIAGEKTARYDTIVPNNAVKEDSNGHFVLVITVKGTPLGNRYLVKRVDVEVEASDESNSAVTGAISEWDSVVTNASKPLENKMQVRLAK
ncbi:MAG: HlyD family efflux transporter periplasmic adaptor subunit, partial [Lachnospiraceae bacterium]|nr:HlyD family efflux transporter periplasmic adaptor subunit [Lachnospiraceae bacterium]